MNTATIVQKLWNPACPAGAGKLLGVGRYCNVLRDDLSAFGYAQADLSAFGYAQADLSAFGYAQADLSRSDTHRQTA